MAAEEIPSHSARAVATRLPTNPPEAASYTAAPSALDVRQAQQGERSEASGGDSGPGPGLVTARNQQRRKRRQPQWSERSEPAERTRERPAEGCGQRSLRAKEREERRERGAHEDKANRFGPVAGDHRRDSTRWRAPASRSTLGPYSCSCQDFAGWGARPRRTATCIPPLKQRHLLGCWLFFRGHRGRAISVRAGGPRLGPGDNHRQHAKVLFQDAAQAPLM